MAFHWNLIDLPWDVMPSGIAPSTSAKPALSLRWGLGDGGRVHSRWTHVCD